MITANHPLPISTQVKLRIPAIVTVCSRFIVTDKLLVAEG